MVYCNTTNGPLCEKGDCSPLHIHVGDLVHPMVRDLLIRVKQHIKVTPTRGVRGRILLTLVGRFDHEDATSDIDYPISK